MKKTSNTRKYVHVFPLLLPVSKKVYIWVLGLFNISLLAIDVVGSQALGRRRGRSDQTQTGRGVTR